MEFLAKSISPKNPVPGPRSRSRLPPVLIPWPSLWGRSDPKLWSLSAVALALALALAFSLALAFALSLSPVLSCGRSDPKINLWPKNMLWLLFGISRKMSYRPPLPSPVFLALALALALCLLPRPAPRCGPYPPSPSLSPSPSPSPSLSPSPYPYLLFLSHVLIRRP